MSTDARVVLANEVRRRRHARRWTQQQLSERSGVSTSWIGRIERADANARLRVLASIAVALGCRVFDLLTPTRDWRDLTIWHLDETPLIA